ncbi:MAG: hypothetical protein WCO09_03335 [bacterium]
MSNIEFNDGSANASPTRESLLYSRFQRSADRPTIVSFLIKKGVVKSENSANIALLIVSALFFLSAVALIYFYFYYTPPAVSRQNRVPPQMLIEQKTQEYIGQGMDEASARAMATDEVGSQ